MVKKAELIITDSYFKSFDVLTEKLGASASGADGKNVVFCEEKISLMAERAICDRFGGSFNTDVYSFSNYLKSRKDIDALSREGSAMAVKRILCDTPLSVLKAGKINLAPTLFDLIVQLKSASVSPRDLSDAAEFLPDYRRGKIKDVATVYGAYEDFIRDNGYKDQSSLFDELPKVIGEDESIKGARVFLVGFTSWTAQIRKAVASLIRSADSVTAVVAGGDNGFLFVNEMGGYFTEICAAVGVKPEKSFVPSYAEEETAAIKTALFNPAARPERKFSSKRVKFRKASTPEDEIKTVAGVIARGVRDGKRFRDYTVAVKDVNAYSEYIKYYFGLYGIPFFIDEKINPAGYPIVRLISSYYDIFRKNYDRKAVTEFFKNPLFSEDKNLTDFMENFFISFNVNYDAVLKPFTLGGENLEKAENFRKSLLPFLKKFDLRGMLSALKVKEKTEKFTARLKEKNESVAAEINAQTYDAVMDLLSDMDKILSGTEISFTERKNVFLSGVSAMELSVIPQFSDAVYVGDYRKTALAKAEYLFAVGLTSDVPNVKEDVSVISDDDIELLKKKINVDPTVRIVNLRARENFGVALLSFDKTLFLSYPEVDSFGKKNSPSDALKYVFSVLSPESYDFDGRYITEKESLLRFAEDCRAYSEKRLAEIPFAAAFFAVSDNPAVTDIVRASKREVKVRLDNVSRDLFKATSPTKIEDYFQCPYRAFARRILRIGDRDDGRVSGLSVGVFMHAVFREYFARVSAVENRADSDALFNSIAEKLLELPEYKKFLADKETEELFKRVIKEAGNYCYKCFLNLEKTKFKPYKFEQSVGYELPESKIKLIGNVDRVDRFEDDSDEYLRIIDYKTGTVKEEDKLLYAGVKIQLYLYAAAFRKENTKISGLYYAPIKEEYSFADKKNEFIAYGKTLDDEKAVSAQRTADLSVPVFTADKEFSEKTLNACIDYAVNICDDAVMKMKDGVIIASPFEGACKNCTLKALCGQPFGDNERKVNSVSFGKIAEISSGAEDE